ncbi:hypothetical protein [Georgenia sp. SYP-B2076]|uniref:hypothetical protein n=1 Tax=Georgenia sp. SYP-B2076 TaxID=2495881 RepID=UPI000F8F6F41|nr:hypothetical protein [Georgenia sp. SYP-B2076]
MPFPAAAAAGDPPAARGGGSAGRPGTAVVMGASSRAAATALGAAAVAVAGYLSHGVLTALVLLLALVFAAGWPRLIDLPTTRGAGIVIALVAVASVAAVLLASLPALALVMGLSVVAAFVHQMLRRDGRPRLVESVSGVVGGNVVVVSAAGWVAVESGFVTEALVVTAAAAIAAAASCTAIPARTGLVASVATVAAGAVGLVTGELLAEVGPVPGLLLGLAAGILTAALHVLFGRFPSSRRVRPAAAAAMLPLLAAGVPVYLVSRLLTV